MPVSCSSPLAGVTPPGYLSLWYEHTFVAGRRGGGGDVRVQRSARSSAVGDRGSSRPSLLHGLDAKVLVGFFSRVERLAAAGKALCARRAATTTLLEAARSEDFSELRRRCGEVKAAKASAEDAAARARRLHAARRLRTWSEGDGTFRLDGRLTPEAGARLLAAFPTTTAPRPRVRRDVLRTGRSGPLGAGGACGEVGLGPARPGPREARRRMQQEGGPPRGAAWG
jgi:hypothetical protein